MEENNNYHKRLTEESKERLLDDELKKGVYSKRAILRVIRLKCLDCCNGSSNEVKLCTCDKTCFLHPFRCGKNPFSIKREYTEEQKEKLREQLKKGRKNV